MSHRTCSVSGCERKHKGHGLCQLHLKRQRDGRPLSSPIRGQGHGPCEAEGCALPGHSRLGKSGATYCKNHYEQARTSGAVFACDSCGKTLPIRTRGKASHLGRWCSDHCQLQIKLAHMISRSHTIPAPGFEMPCLVDTKLTPKGYPEMFASLGGVNGRGGSQVWLGHRISFLAAGREIPEGHDLDHMCQNTACFEPSHLQAVDRVEHSRITWERHTTHERVARNLHIALSHLGDGESFYGEVRGFVVSIVPADSHQLKIAV